MVVRRRCAIVFDEREPATGAVSGCAGCAVSVCWVCTGVTIAMAGRLHGVCVGACWVVSPQGGFSLALVCNYLLRKLAVSCIKTIANRILIGS